MMPNGNCFVHLQDVSVPCPAATVFLPEQTLTSLLSGLVFGDLDPYQLHDSRIILVWEKNAPRFESDFEMYMSEPHRSRLSGYRADLRLWVKSATTETVATILFGHSDSLRAFDETRNDMNQIQMNGSANDQMWLPTSDLLLTIYALLDLVVKDTICFLQECSVELEVMVSLNCELKYMHLALIALCVELKSS